MMLRSTRLCQRGSTLITSLCYSTVMSIPRGSFAMELLWYYYSCIWLGVEKSKTGGFFPLVSLSKKKRRNFNIHLDVLFKLICMKNRTNCITGIIRFLFFSFSRGLTLIWPCFSIPVFFQFMWTKHPGWLKSYVSKCSVLHMHSYPIPVFFLSPRL